MFPIKTMLEKKRGILLPLMIITLVSAILSGCSGTPESNVAANVNINRTATVVNRNVSNNLSNTSVPVANNINVSSANRKPSAPVKDPVPEIGSGAADFGLFAQAKAALGNDPELSTAVIIEIKEGNATLSGRVSSEAQKVKAGQQVQGVKGIKSVKNNLRVS